MKDIDKEACCVILHTCLLTPDRKLRTDQSRAITFLDFFQQDLQNLKWSFVLQEGKKK